LTISGEIAHNLKKSTIFVVEKHLT